MNEIFFGYLLDEQEQYSEGVRLEGADKATDWAYQNKDNAHEVRVVDDGDCVAIQIVKGKLKFPPHVTQDEHGTAFFADEIGYEEFGEICSHCGKQIGDDEVPLRFFSERPPILMARFCESCTQWALATYVMVKETK
jgi:hypothetical protein